MSIVVAIGAMQNTKNKGDLLEDLASKLLDTQNYEVVKELRNTGVELDLLCHSRANSSKSIYVECKAYAEKTNISAEVIAKLSGIKGIKKYNEAWLISTSDLSKDAKGLVDEIERSEDARSFTFYTPEKLITALESANIVFPKKAITQSVAKKIKNSSGIKETMLLVCDFGYFWAVTIAYRKGSYGVVVCDGSSGEIITDDDLLAQIKKLDSPLSDLDFFVEQDTAGGKVANFKPSIENLKFSDKYLHRINDLSIKFGHPEKDDLTLDDIFTHPDLEEIDTKDRTHVNSKKILLNTNRTKRLFILGDDLSGKTALAWKTQRQLQEDGKIAIYISARDIKNHSFNNFKTLLNRHFKSQYKYDGYIDFFKSIVDSKPTDISILIDDFEDFAISRVAARLSFFDMIKEKFGDILIFANKSIELEIMAKAESKDMLEGFESYKILQLGHVRRDELIERWLTVSNDDTVSDGYILGKKAEISKKIDIAVGTNFVPTYPFYLLTMLQLFETGNKNKIQGSSYAELYGYLINHALLLVGVKPEDFDFFHTYLSHLAHHLVARNAKTISMGEIQKFYTQYSGQMDIDKTFDYVHGLLVKAKLLRVVDGDYSFQLNYCHYYFAAKFLSDNIESATVREEIAKLTQSLYKSRSANIVIFLIHHSKNKDIIDQIMAQARRLFDDVDPYTLSKEELAKINGLIQEEIKISYQDSDPNENRKKALARRDEAEENSELEDGEDGSLDLFGKTKLAFKLIEVLGQVANNYYGSLDGHSKVAILEEIYSLGLRGLHAFLGDFDEYSEAMRIEFTKMVDEKGLVVESDKEELINKIIYSFTQLFIYAFIRRISDSVASKNLFLTIDKVGADKPSAAVKLIGVAARLHLPGQIIANKSTIEALYKEFSKNYLPKDLLRVFVLQHMYNFDVKITDKQSICSKLDINFEYASRLRIEGGGA